MTRRWLHQARITMPLVVLGGAALGGAWACSVPAVDRGAAPPGSTSARPAAISAAPVPLPVPEAPAPSDTTPQAPAAPAPASASGGAPPQVPDSDPSPSATSPALARGQCSGRSTLRTAQGEVRCYPYRCREGRCLLSCQKDEDCAGSRGPAEMAEHGWPLACSVSSSTCYPLPPSHVHGD